jgi:MFS transporter, DHA1 family, multidrug resistance protein
MSLNIPRLFLIVIIMMGSVSLFATDIYVPALPAMALHFNCTQSEIQSSFSVFLLGLAICQLIYGVLCDFFGRKRITIIGLSIFILASFLCAFAVTLSDFLFARILQAIGAGVGSVVVRAMIADRFDRTAAVKVFSTTFPIIGLSSAIAPLIGGYLTLFFNWRASFYFMALYGWITLLLVVFYLKETKQESTPIKKLNLKHALQGYGSVLRNVNFLGYALVICCGFAVFRCYTVESPFVFDNQGFGVHETGQFYIALSIAYIIGNLMAKKMVTKKTLERVLMFGFLFFVLGGFAMVLGAFHIEKSPYMVIIPMAIVTLGNGFLFPTSSAGAMTSVSTSFAGTASGLMGALQFILAAACTNWIGGVCQGHALFMSLFISAIILIGLCSFLFLVSGRSKENLIIS